MPINFPAQVYTPTYNIFARTVYINPLASQPGESQYTARGIFNTVELEVVGLDNSILSEQRTILDILETEFSVLPIQGDRVNIPADSGMPVLGDYEIISSSTNGGGETTLVLRKIMTATL